MLTKLPFHMSFQKLKFKLYSVIFHSHELTGARQSVKVVPKYLILLLLFSLDGVKLSPPLFP